MPSAFELALGLCLQPLLDQSPVGRGLVQPLLLRDRLFRFLRRFRSLSIGAPQIVNGARQDIGAMVCESNHRIAPPA